jgi:hypothetical protein
MATIAPSILYVGNDSVISVVGLTDLDGAAQNDAVVSVITIVDAATGEEIAGVDYPIVMEYVAQSAGDYEGLVPYTVDVTVGRDYLATVRAVTDGGNGPRAEWQERLRARVRKG